MDEQITAVQKLINTAIEFCVNYSFQVVGAIIVLIVGGIIANWVAGLVLKVNEKQKTDITLSKFLAGSAKIMVLAFAIIIALGKFGITIAPFIAALGAAAFGATYAIQGPLSNYAAGLSIILSRPFTVGDTITVCNVRGIVQDVKLAATILLTGDGVRITIPNKHIVGEIIHNSAKNQMVDGVVGISYSNDPELAISAVKKVLSQFGEVVTNPPAQIGIKEFGDSSVNISYRYWIPTVKYCQLSYAINLAIYKALQTANISIPCPQREIHIVSQATQMAVGVSR